MRLDRSKVFHIFFGTSKLPRGKIIITPISKFYDKIKENNWIIAETQGWWKRSEITINNKKVTILKIPIGTTIKDCLKILPRKGIEKVIFLGYCGALKKNLKIGKIVMPTTATFNFNKIKNPFIKKEGYKIATNLWMLSEIDQLKKWEKEGISLIDMETYFLYEWGALNKIPIISILTITDQPLSRPFYLVDNKDIKRIDNAVLRIVKTLKNFV